MSRRVLDDTSSGQCSGIIKAKFVENSVEFNCVSVMIVMLHSSGVQRRI